jgi:D-alanyl-lipoteichoic acid acyltransferase DltB (MBOAT superfamily)
MIFNSWIYLVFLAVVFLVYWPLPWRGRIIFLIIAGAVFYGWWDPRFLILLAATTSVDFLAGLGMSRADATPRSRTAWLLASLSVNLGILFCFKYFNFFVKSVTDVLAASGTVIDWAPPYIVLPVGISFYTFQSMAYTIDVYRRKTQPIHDPSVFATYVAFFPPLVAGPIERAQHLVPQIVIPRTSADRDIGTGLWRILWGLYKKVFIADNLARVVATCLDKEYPTAGGVAMGALAFTFQIYCDFSGYTDIALGSARLLGFELLENFRLPFFADSPSDFWSRWHISLSTWLRDYLYIPLGGNRHGVFQTYRNLLLTMLLGGLWHGASWNFIVWGAYHGLLLIAFRLLFGASGRPPVRTWAARVFWIGFMFVLTVIGFGIFRAAAPGQLSAMVQALWIGEWSIPAGTMRDTLFLVSVLLVMMAGQAKTQDMLFVLKLPLLVRVMVIVFLLGSLALFGSTGGVEFIYFQF